MDRRTLLRGFLLLPAAAKLAPKRPAPGPERVPGCYIVRSYSYYYALSPHFTVAVAARWVPEGSAR